MVKIEGCPTDQSPPIFLTVKGILQLFKTQFEHQKSDKFQTDKPENSPFLDDVLQKLHQPLGIVQKQMYEILRFGVYRNIVTAGQGVFGNYQSVLGLVTRAQLLQELGALFRRLLDKDVTVFLHVQLGVFETEAGNVVQDVDVLLVVFDEELYVPVVLFVAFGQHESFRRAALSTTNDIYHLEHN